MKKLVLAAAFTAALAGPAFAKGPDHDHAAKHGGVFVEGKEADYELVARADVVQLYVNDHGRPLDLSNASARLTLLSGVAKQEVELKPADGRLEAKGAFQVGPGTKAVAVVTRGGRTLGTARFTLK